MGKKIFNKLGAILRVFNKKENKIDHEEESFEETSQLFTSTSQNAYSTSESSSRLQSQSPFSTKIKQSESIHTNINKQSTTPCCASNDYFNQLKRSHATCDIFQNQKEDNNVVLPSKTSLPHCLTDTKPCLLSYNVKLQDSKMWTKALGRTLANTSIKTESSSNPEDSSSNVEDQTTDTCCCNTDSQSSETEKEFTTDFGKSLDIKANNETFTEMKSPRIFNISSIDAPTTINPAKFSEQQIDAHNEYQTYEDSFFKATLLEEDTEETVMGYATTEESLTTKITVEENMDEIIVEPTYHLQNIDEKSHKSFSESAKSHKSFSESAKSHKSFSESATEYEVVNMGQVDVFKEFKTTIAKMKNVLKLQEKEDVVVKEQQTEDDGASNNGNISTQTVKMTFNQTSTSTEGILSNTIFRNEEAMLQISSMSTNENLRLTLDSIRTKPLEKVIKKRRKYNRRNYRFKRDRLTKKVYNALMDNALKKPMKPDKQQYNKCVVYHITQHKDSIDRCIGTLSTGKEDSILSNSFSAVHFGPIQEFPVLLNKHENEEYKRKELLSKGKITMDSKKLQATSKRKSASVVNLEKIKTLLEPKKFNSRTRPSLNASHFGEISNMKTTTANWFVFQPTPPLVVEENSSSSTQHWNSKSSTQEFVMSVLDDELKTKGLKSKLSKNALNLIKDHFCDKLYGVNPQDLPDVMITVCVPLREIVTKMKKTQQTLASEDKSIGYEAPQLISEDKSVGYEDIHQQANGEEKAVGYGDIKRKFKDQAVGYEEIKKNYKDEAIGYEEIQVNFEDKAIGIEEHFQVNENVKKMSSVAYSELGVQVAITEGDGSKDNNHLPVSPGKICSKLIDAQQQTECKVLMNNSSNEKMPIVYSTKATCFPELKKETIRKKPSKIFYSDHSTDSPNFKNRKKNREVIIIHSDKNISATLSSSLEKLHRRRRNDVLSSAQNKRNNREGFFLNLPPNRYKKKRAQISKLFEESNSSDHFFFGEPKLLYHVHESSFYSSSKTDVNHKNNFFGCDNIKDNDSGNHSSDRSDNGSYYPIRQNNSRVDINLKRKTNFFNFSPLPKVDDDVKGEPPPVTKNYISTTVNTSNHVLCLENGTQFENDNVILKCEISKPKLVEAETYMNKCVDSSAMVNLQKVRFKNEDEILDDNEDSEVLIGTNHALEFESNKHPTRDFQDDVNNRRTSDVDVHQQFDKEFNFIDRKETDRPLPSHSVHENINMVTVADLLPSFSTTKNDNNNLETLMKEIVDVCNSNFEKSRDCVVDLTLYNLIKDIVIQHSAHLSEGDKSKAQSILTNLMRSQEHSFQDDNMKIIESAIENMVKELGNDGNNEELNDNRHEFEIGDDDGHDRHRRDKEKRYGHKHNKSRSKSRHHSRKHRNRHDVDDLELFGDENKNNRSQESERVGHFIHEFRGYHNKHRNYCDNKCDIHRRDNTRRFRNIEGKEEYNELVRRLRHLEKYTKHLSAAAKNYQALEVANEDEDYHPYKEIKRIYMAANGNRIGCNSDSKLYLRAKSEKKPAVPISKNLPNLPVTKIVIDLSNLKLITKNCISLVPSSTKMNPMGLSSSDKGLKDVIAYQVAKTFKTKVKNPKSHYNLKIGRNRVIRPENETKNHVKLFDDERKKEVMKIKMIRKKTVTRSDLTTTSMSESHCYRKKIGKVIDSERMCKKSNMK